MQIYHDGEWGEFKNQKLAPLNFSFLFGCGIFDTLPVYKGKPLFLPYHTERLFASLEEFSVPHSFSPEEIEAILLQGIEKYAIQNARVRIVIDFGTGSEDDYFKREANASLVIMMMPAHFNIRQETPWKIRNGWFNRSKSNIVFRHKTTSILENFISRERLKKEGVNEALVQTDDGILLEGIFSNIFFVKENALHTPSREMPLLDGTMRRFLLEHAPQHKITIHERECTLSELKDAEGIFMTNSISGVAPVREYNRKEYNFRHPLIQACQKLCITGYFGEKW